MIGSLRVARGKKFTQRRVSATVSLEASEKQWLVEKAQYEGTDMSTIMRWLIRAEMEKETTSKAE